MIYFKWSSITLPSRGSMDTGEYSTKNYVSNKHYESNKSLRFKDDYVWNKSQKDTPQP